MTDQAKPALEAEVFTLHQGTGPVLFSVPHAGTRCPESLQVRLTEQAREWPDTDWFVDRLFGFAPERGQSLLVANNTRYLVDLNRPTSDQSLYPGQATTGLCPTEQFDGQEIYRAGETITQSEKSERIERYWRPYHLALEGELERLRELHGYAVLFDCHSICSVLPRLFDGVLPVLNLGTNHGATAADDLEALVVGVLRQSRFTTAVNGRFVGGSITRTYGRPATRVHALQLEIGWDGYLSAPAEWDAAKADHLIEVLKRVANVLETWRP